MAEGDMSFENILKSLSDDKKRVLRELYYGAAEHETISFKRESLYAAEQLGLDLQGYKFKAKAEETRKPRMVTVGLIQHSIVLPTNTNIGQQRQAIFDKVGKIINIAANEGVNVLCLQEAWSMPFALSTRQKTPWIEFAESAKEGPSIKFLQDIAAKNEMVIISPIIEKDEDDLWNTAVVVSDSGRVMGKHRKNHLPSRGSFDETMWYKPGNLGHPVFETKYGKIAVNICYGRHHPQNWLMFALNGAEIVFNPSATIGEFGETFWGIEARNAAIANSYFTCSINRVGTESFEVADKTLSRSYYGSSYITAPDGVRTPGLSRSNDGLLITSVDLNLCRQTKDKWGFNTTRRLDVYCDELNQYVGVKL